MNAMFDAIVVGGGPAGLSAALILGRCLRRTLVCDSGRYRNWTSPALHGFLSRDGYSPHQLQAEARAQLQRYPNVTVQSCEVRGISKRDGGGFAVQTSTATYVSSGVVIATGTEDQLPDVPGLGDCYGISAHVCPYCDGWENRGAPIAVLGSGDKASTFACMIQQWSRDIVLCTNGGEQPGDDSLQMLQRKDIRILTQEITRLNAESGRLTSIVFRDGTAIERSTLFLSADQQPRNRLLRALGCEVGEHGVVCDPDGGTCVPGVVVAGDVSRDVQLAIVAAAEGARAAIALDRHLRSHSV